MCQKFENQRKSSNLSNRSGFNQIGENSKNNKANPSSKQAKKHPVNFLRKNSGLEENKVNSSLKSAQPHPPGKIKPKPVMRPPKTYNYKPITAHFRTLDRLSDESISKSESSTPTSPPSNKL